MDAIQSFLGTGWSFPPEFSIGAKTVLLSKDADDIQSSLQILLSTKLGERIMQPTYGSNLEEMLFEPMNLTVKTYIQELIATAILYHEPRIDAEKIIIDDSNQLEGELLIKVDYKIRATNSRANMVFPFYKKEGSDL